MNFLSYDHSIDILPRKSEALAPFSFKSLSWHSSFKWYPLHFNLPKYCNFLFNDGKRE